MKLDQTLTIAISESNPMWQTSITTDNVEGLCNVFIFHQVFPHPYLGLASEKVMIKEQDIDKVIEFLSFVKEG